MSKLAPLARDLCGLSGIGLVVAGVASFSQAAAMILTGAVMTAGALWTARRG